ncbi:glycosyltransferase family 4 protein [Sulfurimonas sp.]|uniref:glycosyltransferase family 4 protein n=1 Tax=Sulfurimonas sp. TaxID=2022749 RepID=UPI003D14466B
MELKNKKLLFIHPAIRSYRKGLFAKLAETFTIEYIFTKVLKEGTFNFNDVQKSLKEISIKYKQLNEVKSIPFDNFSFGLFLLPFKKFDIAILSSCVSIPFLFLTPLFKLFGKKVVLFEEMWRYPYEVKKYKFILPIVRIYLKYFVDVYVVTGSQVKKMLVEYFHINQEKIYIAYNTTQITDINDNVNYLGDDSKYKILYLGRIVKYKGLDILIEAMKGIDNCELHIVGDGVFLEECQEKAKQYLKSGSYFFYGVMNHEESLGMMKQCDVFVLPTRFNLSSNVQIESWGFVVNEAMLLSKPIISTKAVGSAYDLLDDTCGKFIEPENVEELTNAIISILDENIDNTLGKNSFERVNKICSHEQNVEVFVKAIESLYE